MITANSDQYVGRFAPTPSGPLHLGSLFTALASYLDAKHNNGCWRLRIDDLDNFRCSPTAITSILKTLEKFGLQWDGGIIYQSQRNDFYLESCKKLQDQQLCYFCSCTRSQLKHTQHQDQACQKQQLNNNQQRALRIKVNKETLSIHDYCLNKNITRLLGVDLTDFIILRKDQLIAYQLASAIDDHLEGITHVIRGNDLLDSSFRQLHIHRCLRLPSPLYGHISLLTGQDGQKLSKQSFAKAVSHENPTKTLWKLLTILGQQPPIDLKKSTVAFILEWAIENWQISKLPNSNILV